MSLLLQIVSFYSLHITTVSGQDISLSQYQGKKILLVNTALASPRAGQLAELRQLKQQLGDSLVVILFPSNTFNNEPRSNEEIRAAMESAYGSSFVIAQKAGVAGDGVQAMFSWLAKASENGVSDTHVTADYYKFLIDRNGNISGAFSPLVSPTNHLLINAINDAE